MLLVHARSLFPPQIHYNDEQSLRPRAAEWNTIGKHFFTKIQINSWSYLNLSAEPLSGDSLATLQEALGTCGMGRTEPNPYDGFRARLVGIGDSDQNDRSIREVMGSISQSGVGIVLVILPVKSIPLYARVKYWADVVFGMI